ncbi:MAG: acetyl-CoA carboxylase biotin carboxyl carrier protein [Coriobacteriales bacterium]|nr:acetyl-CoA carboxylase biotin carboxyl carrier protein [Coriobacteriales bacterium]
MSQPLKIMDTTLRDAHQSLWATRMELKDMLPILEKLDKIGYWALEVWGGATFDTCLRFLDENPWDRLRIIKQKCPKTPLAMLTRGQNLVGYHHYSKEIIDRFIKASYRNGISVFRVFDALNDIRNVRDTAASLRECGAHFEGAISYTMSPVHTLDAYLDYAQQLKDEGADSIAIKDMAGMLTPYRTERLVAALVKEIGLPVHVHCHFVGGMAATNYLKAAEAGASIVDTASAPLAFGNSQPPVEMVVAALKESGYDTGLDLDQLFEISEYWEDVRLHGKYKYGLSTLTHMKVYSHQVPGGMMSNLVSQLETQKASDRLGEVLEEIPRVRAEVGFPPLVTPMSQIVGTQSVFNVLTGKRWSVISKEMKDYLAGYYGKTPGPVDKKIQELALKGEMPLDEDTPPGSLVTTTYAQVEEEIGDLAQSEEDVLMYALFPNESREYLKKHEKQENVYFAMNENVKATKKEDYVDTAQIRELVKMVQDTGIGEVTVEEAGAKITVKSESAAAASAMAGVGISVDTGVPAPSVTPKSASPKKDFGDIPASWTAVTSPMVGTFYEAPAPGEAPFVKEGDTVGAGDVMCIVEAMKLMNEVCADFLCVVKKVCLNDGDAVEFGTPLFYVEPIVEDK